MRIIQARYRSGAEFLRHYQPSFPDGGLFYPTREAIEAGAPVIVEVRLPALPQKVMLRGRIAWRRAGRHRTKLRAGLGIEFAPADAVRREFLLSVARGEVELRSVPARKYRRLPVELPTEWRVAEERSTFTGRIEDIGLGGAFISAVGPSPAPGTEVFVDVVPPGSVVPLGIAARVAWIRGTPGAEGFGIEFRCRDAGGTRRLKELVRRLEEAEREWTITGDDHDGEAGSPASL